MVQDQIKRPDQKWGKAWFRYAIFNIAWNIIIGRELLLHVFTTDFTIDLDALAYRSLNDQNGCKCTGRSIMMQNDFHLQYKSKC